MDEEVDQGHNPVEHDLHVRTTTDPISLLWLSSRTVAAHASHHPEGAQQVETLLQPKVETIIRIAIILAPMFPNITEAAAAPTLS